MTIRQPEYQQVLAHGVRYCLTARAYSNLRLRAQVAQTSHEPGATLTLRALLTEYGMPVEQRASLTATLTRPDQSTASVPMPEVEPGVFEATIATTSAGVYRMHVVAKGHTLRNVPFTREQLLSAGTWHGGDRPPPSGGGGGGRDPHGEWCCLLRCLVRSKGLREWLERQSIDAAELERCLKACCTPPRRTAGDGARAKSADQARARLALPDMRRALATLSAEVERLEAAGED